jgi:hypothetical protein
MAYPGQIVVRLEVDRMRHQILHAFTDQQVELEQIVAEELEKAVTGFDFAAEVRMIVWRELPAMIDDAVQSALRRAVFADDVTQVIDQAVHKAAAKLIEGDRA